MKRIILSSFLVLMMDNVLASDVYYNLLGCNRGPGEFDQQVLGTHCAQQKGWRVHALVSGACYDSKQSKNTQEKLGIALDTDGAKAATLKAPQIDPLSPIAPETQTLKIITDDLEQASSSLQKGDQFFLNLSAHGESDCSSLTQESHPGNKDLGAGNKKAYDCELSFVFRLGGKSSVMVKAKDLVPVLEKIQKRGIKVAASIKSCYGGAAIRHFAKAGICAQAYSTGDSLLAMCGGESTPSERTGTADLTSLQACSGLDPVKLQEVALTAKFEQDSKACIFDSQQDNKKVPGILSHLEMLSSSDKKPKSFATFTHNARGQDRTPNLPMGTSGPFWIVDQMSFMGTSPMVNAPGNKIYLPEQNEIACQVEDYFDRLADHINEIVSKNFAQDCDMKQIISAYVRSHKQGFQQYHDLFKEVSELRNAPIKAIESKLSSEERKRIVENGQKAFQSSLSVSQIASVGGIEKARLPDEAILFGSVFSMMGPPPPLTMQDMEAFTKIATRLSQKQNELYNYQQTTLSVLERDLYEQLRNSENYKRCVAIDPMHEAARKNCEEFRLPQ